jgi:polysaccharide deacetylase family protein (PEP-CTERM system associated)
MNGASPSDEHPINLLTFDVEDWFHILDLGDRQPSPAHWHSLPSRLEANVESILELVSQRGVHATFFVLGWIAEKYPSVVKKLNSCGHEIACHGYGHELISNLTAEQFRTDLRRARSLIENITGKAVRGYRGPGFSITSDNLWAFDVIAEEGFEYDATLYPGTHGHGGIPGLPSEPFTLITPAGYALMEFPVSMLSIGNFRVAFSGGGYFRICPFFVLSGMIRRRNLRRGTVMVYLHPRDLDSRTPRLSMPFKRRFKCYVNVSGASEKLRRLLERYRFGAIRDFLERHGEQLPVMSLRQ